MNKNYMLFPKDAVNKTLEEDVVTRPFINVHAARNYAKRLIKEHKGRYDKIVIAEIITRDVIHAPFTLSGDKQ